MESNLLWSSKIDRVALKEFLKDKTVLLVDDELETIEPLLSILVRKFARVDYAMNGAEGLEKIEALKPDIILSDINMPVMDGIEMCKEGIKRYGKLNLIFITGYHNDQHTLEVESLGYRYICKPVNLNLLYDVIVEELQK